MYNHTSHNFFVIVIAIIAIAAGIGWVKNLIKLTECDFESPYKAEVIHTLGLIPVIGIFTGYMDFGK